MKTWQDEGSDSHANDMRPRPLREAVKPQTCVSNSSLILQTSRLFPAQGHLSKNNYSMFEFGIYCGVFLMLIMLNSLHLERKTRIFEAWVETKSLTRHQWKACYVQHKAGLFVSVTLQSTTAGNWSDTGYGCGFRPQRNSNKTELPKKSQVSFPALHSLWCVTWLSGCIYSKIQLLLCSSCQSCPRKLSGKAKLCSEILQQNFLFQMLEQSVNPSCESQRSRQAGNTFQKCHDAKGKRDHTSYCKIKQVQATETFPSGLTWSHMKGAHIVTMWHPRLFTALRSLTCMRGPDPAPFTVRVVHASRLHVHIKCSAQTNGDDDSTHWHSLIKCTAPAVTRNHLCV